MLSNKGLTLVGLIMSIGVIAVLAVAVFVALDPAAKVGKARDEVRRRDVLIIAEALTRYANKNQGALPFTDNVTTDKKVLCSTSGSLDCNGDSQDCITITDNTFFDKYLRTLPVDPDKTNDTDTGYYITKDANNKVIIGACSTYGEAIAYTTTIRETSVAAATCNGYDDGTYCWFGAASATDSCDTVCQAQGMSCVNSNWNDDTSCTVNLAIWGAGSCSLGCASSDYSFYPASLVAFNLCLYRSAGGNQDCAAVPINGVNRICACQ